MKNLFSICLSGLLLILGCRSQEDINQTKRPKELEEIVSFMLKNSSPSRLRPDNTVLYSFDCLKGDIKLVDKSPLAGGNSRNMDGNDYIRMFYSLDNIGYYVLDFGVNGLDDSDFVYYKTKNIEVLVQNREKRQKIYNMAIKGLAGSLYSTRGIRI